MKLALLFFSLTLASCATVVSGDDGPYGPAAANKKGTVAYNPNGVQEVLDMRRRDALQKIYEVCGGNNYKILKEEVRAPREGDRTGSLATFGADELKFVDYQCD